MVCERCDAGTVNTVGSQISVSACKACPTGQYSAPGDVTCSCGPMELLVSIPINTWWSIATTSVQALCFWWTQTVQFSAVSIQLPMSTSASTLIYAYLSTSLGPGSRALYAASFQYENSQSTGFYYDVFASLGTALDLPPATYYLTIIPSVAVSWNQRGLFQSFVLHNGITEHGSLMSSNTAFNMPYQSNWEPLVPGLAILIKNSVCATCSGVPSVCAVCANGYVLQSNGSCTSVMPMCGAGEYAAVPATASTAIACKSCNGLFCCCYVLI